MTGRTTTIASAGQPRSRPPGLPSLYTVAETAAYARTSTKTVRRWLTGGLLPYHRLGRQIRIAEADLLTFLADRRRG